MFDSYDGASAPKPQLPFSAYAISMDDGLTWLRSGAGEPEFVAKVLEAIGQSRSLPTGLPDLHQQASLQVTIFDNRQKVRTRGDSDFGVAISTWAIGCTARRPIKLNLKLWRADEWKFKLKTMRSAAISPEWKASMAAMIDEQGPDWHYAPVVVRYPGFTYVEGQFVMVNTTTLEAIILDSTTDTALRVTDFERSYHNGKSVEDNILGTARIDFTGESEIWATGQHSWDE